MRGGGVADIRWQALVPLGFAVAFFFFAVLNIEEAVRVRLAALLARKDLVQTVRDRLSFVFILVMPLAFTLFFGILFGANSSTQKLPVAVWDADGGPAAKQLVADLGKSAVVRTVAVNGADLEQQIADDKAAAGLVDPGRLQPGGRGRQAGAAHDRLDARVQRGGDGGQRDTLARRRAGDGGAGVPCCRGGRVGAPDLPGRGGGLRDPGHAAQARPIVAAALAAPAASTKVVEAGAAAGQTPSGFVLSSPGMMVNFILFSLMTAGIALIVERQNGTLQRAHDHAAAPLGAHRRQGGRHVLPHLRAADPADRRRAALLRGGLPARPGRAARDDGLALARGAARWACCSPRCSRASRRSIATTVLVSMAVAALSGAWFPLEITGPAFQTVGHLLPTAWILDGLRGIVVRGFDVADVLPAFAVSLAWAAAFFALAVWRFRLSD